MKITEVTFKDYKTSIFEVCDQLNLKGLIKDQKNILIKPNLVSNDPYPITTPAECCEAIIEYLIDIPDVKITIGEGNGMPNYETTETFNKLGYSRLKEKYNLTLIDLNTAPIKKTENKTCRLFPVMYLPEIAFTHFIISVPMLKAHSISDITGTMKNMMGFLPPKYYKSKDGYWKKCSFHRDIHQSIIELNKYISPDFTIIDATTGMAEFHLGGKHCNPPINKILAGTEPIEVDRKAAELLGQNWKYIGHLN